MLGTLFIQYRVRVVDMDENALGPSRTKRPLQHATFGPERKMAHIAGRPAAAFGGNELVVLPEGAVEKGQITLIHGALPVFANARNTRSVEDSFFFVNELQ